MKCLHCLTSIHDDYDKVSIGGDVDGRWEVAYQDCPECGKNIVFLVSVNHRMFLVYPKGINRNPLPKEVDDEKVINDYNESSLVIIDSPKASAALSRRCLQYILREKAGAKHGNLNDEIQAVIDAGKIPSDIAESLDAVRNIGNFAAHPIKSTTTGEIVEVEPEEAEWNLNLLEELIDFYYVRPARTKDKKDKLNKKLGEAGKPLLK